MQTSPKHSLVRTLTPFPHDLVHEEYFDHSPYLYTTASFKKKMLEVGKIIKYVGKVEKIKEGSLDSIPSLSPSVKIQIME